ncbi:unnamed protein product [Cuscuta campestris]|uniref:Integrase zinc-binding domain-containing protein n=1 Tax=Cuscuta campestris TaxID=132261 RepID=A0A484MNT1_9ASTE|nr:unnamed protein product [Cuscuta campestris]
MGFKFRIEYKTGVSNRAADALSRRDTADEHAAQFTALSQPIPILMDAVRMEHHTKPDVLTLKAGVTAGTTAPAFTIQDGLLYYNRRVYISPDSALRDQLLGEFHNTPIAGHQGVERTFRRLAAVFYWPGCRIHDVFHVSLLRPFVARDTGIPAPTLPTDFIQNRPVAVPLAAIRSRTVLVNGAPEEQWLIHWSEGPEDDGTWEPVSMLRERFPTLRLEDKALSNGGGVDTDQVDSDRREQAGPVAPTVVRRSQRVVGPPQRYTDYIRH